MMQAVRHRLLIASSIVNSSGCRCAIAAKRLYSSGDSPRKTRTVNWEPDFNDPPSASLHQQKRFDPVPEDELLIIPPIARFNESLDVKRARLRYQCRKRGILETELLMSTFAAKHLNSLSEQELADFDKLLDMPDWDIYYWATEKKPAPKEIDELSVFERIKKHAKNEERVVIRMPELKKLD